LKCRIEGQSTYIGEEQKEAKERQKGIQVCQLKFLRAGETSSRGGVEGGGLLGTTSDWQPHADLKGRMQFSQEITVTNQRPDIAIWFLSSRQAIIVQLIVP
jgi:hypothetical protein